MFGLTVISIFKQTDQINMASGKRTPKMEKFVMYLKLFIGMGFIWTFEIISGVFHESTGSAVWYFTDVLNMLQGFYIFAVFVCKRKVFNVIFGLDSNRPGMERGNTLVSSIRSSVRYQN